MLIIEGEFGGKLYDKEKVTFDKALELFQMTDFFDFVRTKDPQARVEFEYHKNRKKTKGGVLRFPSGWRVPNTAKVYVDGRICRITYAESERTDPISKVTTTLPRKIDFGDREKRSLFWKREREKILWLAIHPHCASSPLRVSGDTTPIVWDVVNHGQRADDWEGDAINDLMIRNQFLKDDISVLRRKAKGMGMVFSKDAKDSVIRKALMGAYESAIKKNQAHVFLDKFNKAETSVAGSIQELIDRGFIKQTKRDTVGRVTWQWRPGLPEQGKIMDVQRGVNPVDALKRHMIAQFDIYDKSIMRILTEKVDNKNKNMDAFVRSLNNSNESPSEVPVNELSAEQLVRELKRNDLIGFNAETGGVHLYSEKQFGKFLKENLYKVETPNNWVMEFAVFIEDKKNLETRVSMAERLEKFRNK